MFWAGIWLQDRTWITEMFGHPQSRRGGKSSRSYQNALQEGLLPHYDGSRQFQQDNAPVHTSISTRSWLRSHSIEPVYWPPYSPDLNPIENIWRMLKHKLRTKHPEIIHLQDNEEDRAKFIDWIEDAWAYLDQAKIRKMIESLERRLRAVIQARGWYTKY
jgi:transposase